MRERALLEIVDAMAPIETLALARRVVANRKGDPIIQRLQRFSPERRHRFQAFVVDPKRRAARVSGR